MKTFVAVSLSNIILSLLILPHAHAFYEPGALILTPTAGLYVFDSTSNTEGNPTLGVNVLAHEPSYADYSHGVRLIGIDARKLETAGIRVERLGFDISTLGAQGPCQGV